MRWSDVSCQRKQRNDKTRSRIHGLKGRHTRGSWLPQHAPATRSRTKAPSSAPTISSAKICCATKRLLPSFAPSYQTGLIQRLQNFKDYKRLQRLQRLQKSGLIKRLTKFQRLQIARARRASAILVVFEKIYSCLFNLFQIALEIM